MQQKSLICVIRPPLLEEYGGFVTWTRTPREGAGPLPALLLEKGSLPSAGHQDAREGEQALRLAKQPMMHRFVILLLLLLLVGIMLCCLVVLLSLPLSAPEVSDVPGVASALAGANVGHVDRGAN